MAPWPKIYCGTFRGYQKHYRDKTKPCQPCRDAASLHLKQDYENNPGKRKRIRDNAKKWRENNPDKRARQKARRRAKKKNNKFEPYTLEQVLNRYGTNCHICSDPIDLNAPRQCGLPGWELALHLDHVIPIYLGGADSIKNVKPSHAICNLRKSTKKPAPPS